MSDNVEWVVDLDASLDEAQVLAAKVKDWLLAQGIISNRACAGPSYRGGELLLPGPNAAAWSVAGDAEFPSMHGFGIVTERTVFHTGDNGIQGLRCPRCVQQHDPDDLAWSDAVGAWFDEEGSDALQCPACGCESSIVDWRFLDLDWGFGNLAFGFWNWPITERLAEAIGAVLGHRCRLVGEHI